MKVFSLEEQYQLYLKRIKLSEETMHSEQRKQLKQTFFGACGQMIILLRDEISELEEIDGVKVLEGMLGEVTNFFLKESNQQN